MKGRAERPKEFAERMSTESSPETKIATATKTATDFELTPPDPVPVVAPEKAAGLVPVSEEQRSKLDTKVDNVVRKEGQRFCPRR